MKRHKQVTVDLTADSPSSSCCGCSGANAPGDSPVPELDGADVAVLEGGVEHALIGVPAACDGVGEAGDSTPEPPPCGERRAFLLLLIGERSASLCFSAAHQRGVAS